MKQRRFLEIFFGGLGLAMAVLTVFLSFHFLDSDPIMVKAPDTADECVDGFFGAVCSGDYGAAGQYLYGGAELTSGAESDSETGKLLWSAFVDSLEYEKLGPCYSCSTGVAVDVRLRCLDLDSVTAQLKKRSGDILEARVAAAEDISEIYDSENNYREPFVMDVLREAVEQALREDARTTEYTITLNLVYDRGTWWILPDQMLLRAISGGVAG